MSNEKLFFLFSLIYLRPFPQQKCSTRHCHQKGTVEPCWAGKLGTCRGEAQETAGRAREEGRRTPFRATVTQPPWGWHPEASRAGPSHGGRKWAGSQDTANKKRPSLESQQDKRLGMHSKRNSPSGPCRAKKPRAQNMEMCLFVGVKGITR